MAQDNENNTIKGYLVAFTATLTAALAGVGDVILSFPELIGGFGEVVWVAAGSLFSAFSVSAFTLGEHIDWLPVDLLTQLAILLGLVYVLKLLYNAYQKTRGV